MPSIQYEYVLPFIVYVMLGKPFEVRSSNAKITMQNMFETLNYCFSERYSSSVVYTQCEYLLSR